MREVTLAPKKEYGRLCCLFVVGFRGGESGDGRNDSAYIAKHVMLVPVAGYLGYFLLNWLGRK